MTGLRQLLPHLLASFQVPTGLEGQKVMDLSGNLVVFGGLSWRNCDSQVKMQEQPEVP